LRAVALPLAVDALVISFFLIAVPAGFNIRFAELFAVSFDIFTLAVLAVVPVGGWAVVRTALLLFGLPPRLAELRGGR
jgi:hypothetical protein